MQFILVSDLFFWIIWQLWESGNKYDIWKITECICSFHYSGLLIWICCSESVLYLNSKLIASQFSSHSISDKIKNKVNFTVESNFSGQIYFICVSCKLCCVFVCVCVWYLIFPFGKNCLRASCAFVSGFLFWFYFVVTFWRTKKNIQNQNIIHSFGLYKITIWKQRENGNILKLHNGHSSCRLSRISSIRWETYNGKWTTKTSRLSETLWTIISYLFMDYVEKRVRTTFLVDYNVLA